MNALADNYCALALCILRGDIYAEEAFKRMGVEYKPVPRTSTEKHTQTLEMIELRKQGMTFEQIGAVYGVRGPTVLTRLKTHERRLSR